MKRTRTINKDEVRDFLSKCSPETKIYLGCDSIRFKSKGKWYAEYTTVLVAHIDGNKGCRIFGQIESEADFDAVARKPTVRLMNEVYKVAALYLDLADVLASRDVQVHLDLNANKIHASNAVVNQAIGYIQGTCNVVPMIKPEAFAASYAADRLKSVSR